MAVVPSTEHSFDALRVQEQRQVVELIQRFCWGVPVSKGAISHVAPEIIAGTARLQAMPLINN